MDVERFDGFHPPDGGERRRKEAKGMTSLVGIRFGGGEGVVTVSDRLISDPPTGLVSEPETPKAVQVAPSAVLLATGPATCPDVAWRARGAIAEQGTPDIASMSAAVT